MIKKILGPISGKAPDRRAVIAAFLIAEKGHGVVEGLCITPPPELHSPIETASIPAALGKKLRRIVEEEQTQVVAAARQMFDDLCHRYGAVVIEGSAVPASTQLSARWRAEVGSITDILPNEARLADLVVFARDEDGDDIMGSGIEVTLFEAGKPLLLTPLAEPASIGKAPAVAWDGGLAATRAVAAAMPLLREAGQAVISRLAETLAWHGITARIHDVPTDRLGLSDALVHSAQELGCDLLVMGGYGHNRIREIVLGGVTRDILRRPAALPILMAH